MNVMSTSSATQRFDCWPPPRVSLRVGPELESSLRPALARVGMNVSADRPSGPLDSGEMDLLVCDRDTLESSPQILTGRGDGDAPAPLLAVLGVPEDERMALLARGADLVVGPGFEAAAVAAQLEALIGRLREERDRNPLTGLPGNRRLQACVRARLEVGRTVGLVLLDIDGFKAFNDSRGHLSGDAAIEMLAESAAQAVSCDGDAVVTHVGGDDFCIVTAPDQIDRVARSAQREFSQRVAGLLNGNGETTLTLTAVATTVGGDRDMDLSPTFARLAVLKDEAKQQSGSTYIRDEMRARE